MHKHSIILFLLPGLLLATVIGAWPQHVTPLDLMAVPSQPPDASIAYGPDSLNFGELRIPDGPGPYPTVIVIHGGCWLSIADLHIMDHMCDALKKAGFATWNLEYRRIDSPGGGWPHTFIDVGRGIDHIRTIAEKYNLDLSRVALIGHSSGGHLALWSGARHLLDKDSPLYTANPFKPKGVVSLAGPAELRNQTDRSIAVCGTDVIGTLLGGSMEEVPDRYLEASPIALLPNDIKQIVIYGSEDPAIPPELGAAYVAAGKSAGEEIGFIVIPGASHFELITPWTSGWPLVQAAVTSVLVPEQEADGGQ